MNFSVCLPRGPRFVVFDSPRLQNHPIRSEATRRQHWSPFCLIQFDPTRIWSTIQSDSIGSDTCFIAQSPHFVPFCNILSRQARNPFYYLSQPGPTGLSLALSYPIRIILYRPIRFGTNLNFLLSPIRSDTTQVPFWLLWLRNININYRCHFSDISPTSIYFYT